MKLHLFSLWTTIIISRIFLWLVWQSAWMAPQIHDSWHHAYTGLIILACGLLLRQQQRARAISTGVGLGLVFDEIILPLCFMGWQISYWDFWSWAPAVIAAGVYSGWQWRKRGSG